MVPSETRSRFIIDRARHPLPEVVIAVCAAVMIVEVRHPVDRLRRSPIAAAWHVQPPVLLVFGIASSVAGAGLCRCGRDGSAARPYDLGPTVRVLPGYRLRRFDGTLSAIRSSPPRRGRRVAAPCIAASTPERRGHRRRADLLCIPLGSCWAVCWPRS